MSTSEIKEVLSPSKEEAAGRLAVIPDQYKEITKKILDEMGQDVVYALIAAPDARDLVKALRTHYALSPHEFNATLDVLRLSRAAQTSWSQEDQTDTRSRTFITSANATLVQIGSLVTVNGVVAEVTSPADLVKKNERNLWATEFSYRSLEDPSTPAMRATIDADSVIYLGPRGM